MANKTKFLWDIPVYSVTALPSCPLHEGSQILCVSGGGGSSKTGIFNKIAVIALKDGLWTEKLHEIDVFPDVVTSLRVHPNGQFIACAIDSRTFIIPYNKETGKLDIENSKKFQTDFLPDVRDRQQKTLSYSPEGDKIATGGSDGTLRVWNSGSHTQLKEYKTEKSTELKDVSFSPTGSHIVSVQDTHIQLWDVEKTDAPVWILEKDAKESRAIFKNAKWAVDGKGDTILFVNKSIPRKESSILKFVFPGGLKDLKKPKLVKKVRTSSEEIMTSLAVDTAGQFVGVGGSEGTTISYNQHLQKMNEVKKTHNWFVSEVSFSGDGKYLISVSGDYHCNATEVRETIGVNYRLLFILLALLVLFIALYLAL
ncbi:hypothetical protein PROFUN_10072 [Planoprotostelium fungivorum]|uniref:Uncharacterized protein n=1 Tax=Planoprotostelium fungivorum TaxID=1890364 RepID=A0A2P6NEZ4_9EUKA|nr:hypothetical protein PROFUN_10072 [Planoprotostelium fungivorum]